MAECRMTGRTARHFVPTATVTALSRDRTVASVKPASRIQVQHSAAVKFAPAVLASSICRLERKAGRAGTPRTGYGVRARSAYACW